MEGKNILIVDDHAVIRKGMIDLLQDFYADLKLLESWDADTMLLQFRQHPIDVLIMDINLPNTDSIRIVELVTIRYPKTYTLVFSMLPENIYGRRMLQAGARGFLSKGAPLAEVREAMDLVMQQKTYISKAMADLLNDDTDVDQANPFSRLSQREFEIANFMLAGMNIHAIARQMNLKQSTVGTYKSRIFEKLRISNLFELRDLAFVHDFRHQQVHF